VAAGKEDSSLLLVYFYSKTIQHTCRGPINASLAGEPKGIRHGFEEAKGSQSVGIGCVFSSFIVHSHVTLSTLSIDLCGLHLLDDADQVGTIREIAIVQVQMWIAFMRVLIEVVEAVGVEAAGASLDAPVPHNSSSAVVPQDRNPLDR